MTEWELQQVTDTLVMARDKGLMPTIARMLITLADERAALLSAAKAYVHEPDDGHGIAREADLLAAIAKAES